MNSAVKLALARESLYLCKLSEDTRTLILNLYEHSFNLHEFLAYNSIFVSGFFAYDS